MRHTSGWVAGLAAAMVLAASGCASNGSWMGADAEKAYDKDLEAKRLAEVNNNDDYFELHRDGRIYVLSDVKDYQTFLATDEIPLIVTKIGAGPQGETVKLALIKREAKAMEKIVGYKGGAQRMFEGDLAGLEKGFYGEVHKNGQIYVFDKWNELAAFRKGGTANGTAQPGAGPKGETVVFVAASADAQAEFKTIYGK